MVGVPGKNNGCHTCRRRRIRCDRAVPDCLRCTRTGLECEGYLRDTVFIHRTMKGLSRRCYFDETRLRPTAQQQTAANALASFGPVRTINYGDSLGLSLAGHFLDTWLPSSDLTITPLGEWVVRAFNLTQPGELLGQSLNALTITLAGHKRNDAAMLQCGQAYYGRALQALRKAVGDPKLVLEDCTLAALQAIRLYELCLSNSNVIQNFIHHIYGSTQLLLMRGPGRNNTAISRAITRDLRYAAMTCALQTQARSPLGDSDWRTRKLRTYNDFENTLTDLGYDLAALVHSFQAEWFDCPKHLMKESWISEEYHQRAVAIGLELTRWYEAAVSGGHISVDWPFTLLRNLPSRPKTLEGRRTAIDFDVLHQSLLIIDYWALSLGLEMVFDMIRSRNSSGASEDVDTCQARRERQSLLSKKIFAAAKYQCREEHGFNAASRCTMSLRAALYPLRTYKSPENDILQTEIEHFIFSLTHHQGVRYAGAIIHKKGNWEEGHEK